MKSRQLKTSTVRKTGRSRSRFTGDRVRGKPHRTRANWFPGIVIALCAVAAVLVAANAWTNQGQVYEGVEVGTVSVGGTSHEEAGKILNRHASGALEEITVRGYGRDFTVDSRELGVEFDAAAAVESAYAVGRRGNVLERLADRLDAATVGVWVRPEVDYQPEATRGAVKRLSARVDEEPANATLSIEGAKVEVVEARKGYQVNAEETARNIDRSVESLNGEPELVGRTLEPEIPTREAEQAADKIREALSSPVTLAAGDRRWTLSPEEVGRVVSVLPSEGSIRVGVDRESLRASIPNVYGTLEREPVEADFVLEDGTINVTEGRIGRKIEENKLFAAMEDGLFEGRHEYEVPILQDKPDLTTAEAERIKPTTVLGEYGTDYTWDTDPGRRINMERASEAISGSVVAPGEVFSYNAIAEPLDYEDAKVIENGGVEYAQGGGLSQVSSTLYMTANLAGLEIIEANPHYAELPYIRPGFDTTVWFGALDLRFKNNTDGYILIEQWQGADGQNHARIHGWPTGKEVEMTSRKIYEGKDSEGKPTTRWVVQKTVTRNEEVLYDGVFRRVTYKELAPYKENEVG